MLMVPGNWHRLGRRKWFFVLPAGLERSDVVRLVDPTQIPSGRYVKVKSDANPFDRKRPVLLSITHKLSS